MINPTKLEIDRIYSKIDKIAKKGSNNFVEYYAYINTLVNNGKYDALFETLENKYDFNIAYMEIEDVKKDSWKQVLFKTNSSFQDSKASLIKKKNVYQNGLYYYKQLPRTKAFIVDENGKGADLLPVIVNGGVDSITVLKSGSNYSASASVVITGGLISASASPIIKQGKIFSVNITATGSNHNQDIKLGIINEEDVYDNNIGENKITSDIYQKIIGNKRTKLIATKHNESFGMTFSNWNNSFNYDKNLLNLYNSAIDYLLS
jgi:hypothetical protein